MEREEEMAFIGPGSHDTIKNFGTDIHHKMHFGRPFSTKPSFQVPAPGTYDSNVSFVRPKKSAVKLP